MNSSSIPKQPSSSSRPALKSQAFNRGQVFQSSGRSTSTTFIESSSEQANSYAAETTHNRQSAVSGSTAASSNILSEVSQYSKSFSGSTDIPRNPSSNRWSNTNQTQQQQQVPTSQLLSRPGTTQSSSATHPGSSTAVASTTTVGGGGSSSGSYSNSSPAATNTSSGGTNLSKIVIAQVFLLVSTMKDSNWDEKAHQIRQLCDQHGMEVYTKLIRRLISGNLLTIFPPNNSTPRPDTPQNYRMLQEEIQKAAANTDDARKLAEAIGGSDSEGFKEFDLAGFMRHFNLDALERSVFALGFKSSPKSDLRMKAHEIITVAFDPMLDILSDPTRHVDWQPELVARFLNDYFSNPSPTFFDDDSKMALSMAARNRYKDSTLPPEVAGATDILRSEESFISFFLDAGPRSTNSVESVKDVLKRSRRANLLADEIADMVVMMTSSQNSEDWVPEHFISAVLDEYLDIEFNWNHVITHMDRPDFHIKDANGLVALLQGFLKAVEKYPEFEIARLWSSHWANSSALLSVMSALASTAFARFDIKRIPNQRRIVTSEDFVGAPASVGALAATYDNHPMNSLDAVHALLDLATSSSDDIKISALAIIEKQWKLTPELLLVGAFRTPKPWSEGYAEIAARLFSAFYSGHPSRHMVFYLLWKFSRVAVVERFGHLYNVDHATLPNIMDITDELGATKELSRLVRFEFALDLACAMSRHDQLNLQKWLEEMISAHGREFIDTILIFLENKGSTDYDFAGEASPSRRPESLTAREVSILLDVHGKEDEKYPKTADTRDFIVVVQRRCIQTYPRLINLNQGHDDIILDSNQNNFSPAVDKRMQSYYQRMYGGQLSISQVIEELQNFKNSDSSEDQDLFACMIHSLFDEYSCYVSYPVEPLATTAVLFGSLIEYRLLDGLALHVALGMVLEAVKNNDTQENMFKFGLQALNNFPNRLREWKNLCKVLITIPGLQGHDVMEIALEVTSGTDDGTGLANGVQEESNGSPYMGDGNLFLPNGDLDESEFPKTFAFKSLRLDPLNRRDIAFEDPPEDVQDKVSFVVNNMTASNLEDKLKELQEFLVETYFQWFADYLVVQRARLELNNHKLYIDFLDQFGSKRLTNEVIYESFRNAFKLLNSESIVDSSTERQHLKTLGGWIGGLTLAKDKPIKHKNIAFKELIMEGYDRKKLNIVLPFTCKVLEQAVNSKVFMPPNPWFDAIMRLLAELYFFGGDLSLNLKFEIEVLCKNLGFEVSTLDPSTELRDRQQIEEDPGEGLADGMSDLALLNYPRDDAQRPERFSESAINSIVPNLSGQIIFNPSVAAFSQIPGLKRIVQSAIDLAIREIISPVVERSVTIASISTTQLIVKDFAMEPSDEKMMKAAHNMVQTMAGSLALVTCKEPLRMSMSNHIRTSLSQAGYADHTLPDQAILVFVNDNLEMASTIIEKAAQEKSVPEIDDNLQQAYAQRRQHRADRRGNQPFADVQMSRFNQSLPDPFRLKPGGLVTAQLGVYEDFARMPRMVTDVTVAPRGLQDGMNDFAQIGQPSDGPSPLPQAQQARLLALQGGARQGQQGQRQALPPPQLSGLRATPNPAELIKQSKERLYEMFDEVLRLLNEKPADSLRDLEENHLIVSLVDEIVPFILQSQFRDVLAQEAVPIICTALFTRAGGQLDVEVLITILERLCTVSSSTQQIVVVWLSSRTDDRLYNLPVMVSLVKSRLYPITSLDISIAKGIEIGSMAAIEFLSDLMREIVLGEYPMALRTDFATSLDKLMHFIQDDPHNEIALSLLDELHKSEMPPSAEEERPEVIQKNQMMYLFEEWMELYEKPSSHEKMYIAFIAQLHHAQVFDESATTALFFKFSIETCIDMHAKEIAAAEDPLDGQGYSPVDALAALTIYLVKYQLGGHEEHGPVDKAEYLGSLLSVYTLVLNNQHETTKNLFNQKIFFRLFSSLLCEYSKSQRELEYFHESIMKSFLSTFLTLQPARYPAFAFAWTGLVSHRMFMPKIICFNDQNGLNCFLPIMEILFKYLGELQRIPKINQYLGQEYYKGLMRITLVLFHDFPDFLAEYHYLLCEVVPPQCTQLRNVILSAFPSNIMSLPDPFTQGLKVDRLEEIKISPPISGDIVGPINRRSLKEVVDDCLAGNISTENVQKILAAVPVDAYEVAGISFDVVDVDIPLLNALSLYIARHAIHGAEERGEANFQVKAPHTALIQRLAQEMSPQARYFFLGSIVNQLRYPNSHTHYFSCTLLSLFGHHEQMSGMAVRDQITRVLLERLIVRRPHPWGLIITLLELLKNPSYDFWNLSFIKASPDVRSLLLHVQMAGSS